MNAMRYIARTLPLLLALGVQAAQPLDIVKQTGLKGGLVVHLGCGNGDMTAAFRVADNVRVQGLDRSGARGGRSQPRSSTRARASKDTSP